MSACRNSLLAALLAALAGSAAAQDGSGIPRDPSQDFASPTRAAPDRRPSLAVPLAPEGTIGNPASPAAPGGSGTLLPDAVPSATQDGAFAEPSDGAVNPNLPSALSGPADITPTDTPLGETVAAPTRQQLVEHQGYTITPNEVETQPIDAVDPAAAGTLTAADGGLGDDLWTDTDYATIAGLLEDLPVATHSPAMNALVRRLLLTGAKTKEAPPKGPTLFDIRTRRLADAGRIADLVTLLDAEGGGAGDGQARATALLLTGRAAEACGASNKAADAAALQARAACQLAAGDTAAAALSADLARVKGVTDPAFFALVAHLCDGAPLDPKLLTHLTPATYALASLAKAKLTQAALDEAAPGVLAAIARDKAVPPDVRLAAAERAAAIGAIDADTLTTLLRAAKGSRMGDLVQAAFAADGLAARGKAIAAVMAAADAQGDAALYARVIGPAAWDAAPAADAAASTDAITRVLELSGRGDRAADWLNVMTEAALGRGALDELLVRVAVGAPTGPRVAAAREALGRLAEAAPYDEAKALRIVIYAGALDAMGFEIPPAAQSLLASSTLMAAPPVGQVETAELAEAARSGRKGEAVLRALIALGPAGPAEAHPAVVIETVAALSAAGFKADASAVALEAALARGPGGGG